MFTHTYHNVLPKAKKSKLTLVCSSSFLFFIFFIFIFIFLIEEKCVQVVSDKS